MGGLLKSIRELEQGGFLVGRGEEGYANWKPENESGGHGDMRVTGDGCGRAAATREIVAV